MADVHDDSSSDESVSPDPYEINDTLIQLSPNHPLFLHPNDHPGMKLISHVLTDVNYSQWSRAMTLSLESKIKLGMINGTSAKPKPNSKYLGLWNRCNSMVISWLTNVVSPDIATSIVYLPTAQLIWEDLQSRYSKTNAPKIFQIRKDLASLAQGHLSVSAYYTKFRSMWDEYYDLTHLSKCTCNCQCGHTRQQEEFELVHKLTQFLMGLNESFTATRGQILLYKPLPTVKEALHMLLQEEQQRGLTTPLMSSYEPDSNPTALLSKGNNYSKGNSFKGKQKGQFFCDFCHGDSYTRDRYFFLNGYPDWHPLYGTKSDMARMPKNHRPRSGKFTTSSANNVTASPSDTITGLDPSSGNTSTSSALATAGISPTQLQQLLQLLTANPSTSDNASAGGADVPVTGAAVKQTDATKQKSTPGVPKAPSSNVAASLSDATAPATPAKAPGDPSRSFPLQFGSISPGFMNGVQIPARTNSAPPDLDEQKRDQVRHASLRGPTSTFPTPIVPKQQLPKQDAGTVDQSNITEPHPIPKAKRDVHVTAPPAVAQTQKLSGHPIPGISMPMPFHQSQLPMQYGGPNPQMQSQAMVNSSMPMPIPIPLPMGNSPQVQPQVFVPGIQHHPLQPQGIMHQAQSLNFSSQMGPSLAPQLGNMGMGLGPQYHQQQQQQQQQQAGKYGGARKTVKITHPDTHEELRLDRNDAYGDSGLSVLRSRPSMPPPQSQTIPTYPPAHPMNFYPNSYNASPIYFQSPGSVTLTSPQIPPSSQAPRFNQVTIKPASSLHGEKVGDSPLLQVIDNIEFPKISRPRGEASSALPQRDSISESSLKQSNSTAMPLTSKSTSTGVGSVPAESVTSVSSAAVDEIVIRQGSIKDDQKKPGKKGQVLLQDQVGGQSTSVSSLPSQLLGVPNSSDSVVPETTKSIPASSSLRTSAAVSEIASKPMSTTAGANVREKLGSESDSSKEGLKSLGVVGGDSSLKVEVQKPEKVGQKEQGELLLPKGSKHEDNKLEISLESTSKSSEAVNLHPENSQPKATSVSNEPVLETTDEKREQAVGSHLDDVILTSTTKDPETPSADIGLSTISHGDKALVPDDTLSRLDRVVDKGDVTEKGSGSLNQELAPVTVSVPETTSEVEGEGMEINSSGLASPSAVGSKDKSLRTTSKGKKKKREMLQKADAQGTTADLYNAYKGPGEKRDALTSTESTESPSITLKQVSADVSEGELSINDKPVPNKPEPDDWEDAADISTPKLETPQGLKLHDEDESEGMTKKYSRDFLLKFSEQCNELPGGFEITSDIEALIASNVNIHREPLPSPGRAVDRPAGGPRLDRRASFQGEDDKWSKQSGPLAQGRDLRLDIGYGGNMQGFRPGPGGGNYGVLRIPRAQTPTQHAGGILSGPMQSPSLQGGVQRNNSDSDRWQRSTSFHKGLIPSPQTPLQAMHKAERKYEVGKITDEEEAKQRQLKGILNKLTPQNFEKLFEQVKQVNIDNVGTLIGVINQIFDKALMEPTFCEMYANFCLGLAGELPDFSEDNEKITFKRLLLNKCQEEFERGEKEQEEANRVEEEGEVKQTEEQREEKRIQVRRRMLGNIRLIGELYKKKMLTERIMHACIHKLLGEYQNPDEEDIEALCKLMSTIGEMIDHPKAKEHMDAYFEMMYKLSNNMKLSSRVRFMLKDSIDLRKNKWQQRRKVEGPKKIEDVHRDAAQERQAQASWPSRGPSFSSSGRRGQPSDFAPRGSNVLPSPNSQMGGFRGSSQPLRGYANQDARHEERHAFENRPLSVPLRSVGNDSITFGPKGGLARGMSLRGQPSIQSIPIADMPSPADSRRATAGPNGYGSVYTPERFVSPPSYDHSSQQERNMNYTNRDTRNVDRTFDRPPPTSPPTGGRGPSLSQAQIVTSDKVWPEERLREKSIEAIKEFYSAKDEKEVALCIKELNAPSFYPSMISIWVNDSFERKDLERDLLAKLLISLAKSHDAILNKDQLVKGFESVLASLEDTVTDAPKAGEFLGRILAKVVLESAIPYGEVWKLIYEGGEEQGQLVEVGLAAEVVGVILEIIKSEKGDPFLKEIRGSSNLRVENFRPPGSKKSLRIDKFI